ncbi:para-aminobenzoate synthetase component 2 [Kineosphaera limosa]|uniref:Putative glutamine amidotransferase n=1 Tax=Kineosphaera limosa NBRC 100340 TaxID=1184609 RepID=K6X996_9MICO|nr:aminodeoxychorismate/anthranilate synthase component II [Kineosphaera limosa]NYE00993.1 para-aminobenzoate synthetase component 2 [Kineosphaera limosa]GAB95379.1 putative glutamine amidotransferase [Kineosphaera limosa NBRC 100340]
MTAILVVDNYDSFVYTIVGYLQQLGAECTVVRNDEVDLEAVGDYDGVLISPGPGTPAEAGASIEVIRRCGELRVPMLGVCLGHQALAVVTGAVVGRAAELLHGKTSLVEHDGTGVLAGLPSPFTATRYHSLAIEADTVGPALVVNGHTPSGVIMAARHAHLPLHGVQFHPESVLTEGGHRLLANWLVLCGHTDAVERSAGLGPLVSVTA